MKIETRWKPRIGDRVMFGHLLLDSERTGTVVGICDIFGLSVTVDFLPEDGWSSVPKVVNGCLALDEKPVGLALPASRWQYCYPIP